MNKILIELTLKCTNVLFDFINIIIKYMPVRVKAQFVEKLIFFSRLDFSKADIKLIISSNYSLVRLRSCSKEKHTVNWINTFSLGEVFYDIGANVGAYSLIASKFGKCDKIYSFEPVPGTFHELLTNIKLNNISNILACNICLSNSNSISTFRLSSNLPGSALHAGINSAVVESENIFLCATVTLDNFIDINKAKMPNHLKIDVDGAELSILKGAIKTLASKELKSLQIEIDESSHTYNEIISILNINNFKIIEKYYKDEKSNSSYDAIFKK